MGKRIGRPHVPPEMPPLRGNGGHRARLSSLDKEVDTAAHRTLPKLSHPMTAKKLPNSSNTRLLRQYAPTAVRVLGAFARNIVKPER